MNSNPIKVLIADDHTIFLDGLKMLLETDPSIEVLGYALNGQDLVDQAITLKPDVVVTDIMMPGINGIDAIKKIHEQQPIPCIALSTFDSESFIMDAIDAGATGYVVKNAGKGEIIKAIKSVNNFLPYYCKVTEAKILKIISKTRPGIAANDVITFSEREIEIIKLISREISSEEIGKKLFASKRTIDGIRARLLSKMNVKSSAGIILYALKNRLIRLEDT